MEKRAHSPLCVCRLCVKIATTSSSRPRSALGRKMEPYALVTACWFWMEEETVSCSHLAVGSCERIRTHSATQFFFKKYALRTTIHSAWSHKAKRDGWQYAQVEDNQVSFLGWTFNSSEKEEKQRQPCESVRASFPDPARGSWPGVQEEKALCWHIPWGLYRTNPCPCLGRNFDAISRFWSHSHLNVHQ